MTQHPHEGAEATTPDNTGVAADGLSYTNPAGSNWLEREHGRVVYFFEETERNNKFIEMIDRGRNVRLPYLRILDGGDAPR